MRTGRHGRAIVGVTAALALCGFGSASANAATIASQPNSNAGALAIAQSMFQNPALITGASFVAHPPGGTPNAVVTGDLSFFPQNGDTFGLLTTGNSQFADDPNTSGRTAAFNGGAPVRGNTDRDVVILKVDFTAPANTNCLSVGSFAFYSEEYPEWVGSNFNDAFIAELDVSNWTTSGSTIDAPNNFAFDQNGNVISINAAGASTMSASNATGTTYDGATQLLQAAKQVTPGTHSLYLSIFDQGDEDYDSAVMIDNVIVGTVPNPGQACQPGAQEQNYNMTLTPASATNPVGTNHTVTATVSNAETGNAVSGGDVQFTISGVNTGSTVESTNGSGDASFTYTGANGPGTDTIIACFDADDDGNFCEAGEPTASATKTWEQPQSSVNGRMVSNGARSGAKFASTIDCPASVANANHRPFTVQQGASTFKLTNVTTDRCFDDPSFTPSPAPAATNFDTQEGTGAGTVNGASGYTIEWRFEDRGAPSANDRAMIRVTRNSDGAVIIDVPLGTLSSGQNYALPPASGGGAT
jgi:hypothetical protein